ncbi:MAG: FAD-binding protein, partial [Woeseiaceae bacterium]|nr:FAD-binding protein [Woeseiaceae bacterium]
MGAQDKDAGPTVDRRTFLKGAGLGAAAALGPGTAAADPGALPETWDLEADVVVIGSGPTGLTAANRARDAGASVIIVEANYDAGGHGLMNGGTVQLGGGTAQQKKWGVDDSPDQYFRDLTDWSVVETNGMPEYRYNDRAIQRALADNSPKVFDYLVANGVVFEDIPPTTAGAHAVGISAPRAHEVIWRKGQGAENPRGGGGGGIYRPLELAARKKGVRFLFNYHMDTIFREQPGRGRVIGVEASYRPRYLPGETTPMRSFHSNGNIGMTQPTVTVRAKKAIVVGTGGSTGNVEFRRIFDPRVTDVYQLAGSPYSDQDGSGEMAAMAIGASLWGTANHTFERNGYLRKRPIIGCQYTYIEWTPDSILFPFVRATGLEVRRWDSIVLVNQVGKRFYNEHGRNWPYGTHYRSLNPYIPGDWRNPRRIEYKPENFLDAALAPNEGSEPPDYAAGPVWAIFDAAGVEREGWDLSPPATDPDYFFSADTLEELAKKVQQNPYQRPEMPGDWLAATIERYNQIVDFGYDPDFERPDPKYRIETPPYYAAWSTPVIHDCYVGLRIN